MSSAVSAVSPSPSAAFGRRSIWAGLSILAIALFYAAALPRIAETISEDDVVTPDVPFEVVAGIEIVPEPGWAVEIQEESLTRLIKEGAAMVVVGPTVEDDVEEAVRSGVEALELDPAIHWEVGPPSTSTSNAGDTVITFEAHTATHAQQTWLVVHGQSGATVLGSAPDGLWVDLGEEIAAMVDSLVFTDPDR